MMTPESVRAALSDANPYEGIDRLVRAELAAGRTTAAVHAELLPLVKPTRKGGLTDDADEALLGALDALTGACHPASRYTDPAPDPIRNGVPVPSGRPADAPAAR